MLRLAQNLFRRPSIRMGSVDNARIGRTHIKNAQFVSFLEVQGMRMGTDRHDASLRRRRAAKLFLVFLLGVGFAWFALESAQALSMF